MEQLVTRIHAMKEEDYAEFMKTLHVGYPRRTTELTNNIVNYWKREDAKLKKGSARRTLPSTCRDQGSKPRSSQVEGGGGGTADKVSRKPFERSAWKSGLIFRGDKIPVNGTLFMDVEKVTLRKDGGSKKHEQKAATVAVVNEDGKLVLWAFIQIPHQSICQYSPKITNLDERILGSGVPIDMVHRCLDKLDGNLLVGASLMNDLKSLDYKYGKVFDIQDVFKGAKGPFALSHIATQLLKNRSGFQAGQHSAIDDAWMTLSAYKLYKELNGNGTFCNAIQKLTLFRNAFNLSKPRYYSEKCTCTN